MNKDNTDVVKIHRAALACTIYANSVDIAKPMYWADVAKKAFEAADKFIEYFKANELQKDPAVIKDLEERVKTLLTAKSKENAIVLARATLNCDLAFAKEFVDSVESEYTVKAPIY